MRPLRCAILLFASSMAVKTLLVALFTLWGLIAAREFPVSMSDFIEGALLLELVFAIPLYLIYLPIFIYRIDRGHTGKGFLRLTALLIGFALYLLNEITEPKLAPHDGIIMFIAWTAYLLATFELHMYWIHKEINAPASESTKRKVSYIFYWTGIPAALTAGIIMGVVGYIFIAIHSCLQGPACSPDFIIKGLYMSGYTLEIIGWALLVGIIAGLAFYIGILYPLYGFFIKRLWQKNNRSYAHFALAATTTIFWMGLSYF
ncbi:MAG TPA: hypothetical protein VHP34_11940, partial [Alphaproteobacteria bacterium]|nr:hypothetical protein [Alphaproteobacteria bacterium]